MRKSEPRGGRRTLAPRSSPPAAVAPGPPPRARKLQPARPGRGLLRSSRPSSLRPLPLPLATARPLLGSGRLRPPPALGRPPLLLGAGRRTGTRPAKGVPPAPDSVQMNTDPGMLGPANTALGFLQIFFRGMSAASSLVMIHRIQLGLLMLLACCGCCFSLQARRGRSAIWTMTTMTSSLPRRLGPRCCYCFGIVENI